MNSVAGADSVLIDIVIGCSFQLLIPGNLGDLGLRRLPECLCSTVLTSFGRTRRRAAGRGYFETLVGEPAFASGYLIE